MLKNHSNLSCFYVYNDNVAYCYWQGIDVMSHRFQGEPIPTEEIPPKVQKAFDKWIFHVRTKRYYEILFFLSIIFHN